jgi:hypothetical protein
MNPALIQWGPALLILFGIVLGVIYNNRSINHLDARISGESSHLSTRLSGEIGHLSTRIDDLIRNEEIRHNDLKDFIKSEVRRLEDRIERIERPVIRS